VVALDAVTEPLDLAGRELPYHKEDRTDGQQDDHRKGEQQPELEGMSHVRLL